MNQLLRAETRSKVCLIVSMSSRNSSGSLKWGRFVSAATSSVRCQDTFTLLTMVKVAEKASAELIYFCKKNIELWRQEHGNQFPYNLINVLQKTFHRFEELVSLGRNVTLLCMCPFTAGAETRFYPLQMIFLVIVWFLQSVRSCWPNVFCEWNIICEIWWHQWIVNR